MSSFETKHCWPLLEQPPGTRGSGSRLKFRARLYPAIILIPVKQNIAHFHELSFKFYPVATGQTEVHLATSSIRGTRQHGHQEGTSRRHGQSVRDLHPRTPTSCGGRGLHHSSTFTRVRKAYCDLFFLRPVECVKTASSYTTHVSIDASSRTIHLP